jgi:thioredoxin 1
MMSKATARRWWFGAGATAVLGLILAFTIIVVPRWSGDQPAKTTPHDDPVSVAIGAGKPTVVEFGSNWCRSCRDMKLILATLAREQGERLNVVDIDLLSATGRQLAPQYRIQMMPTQVFLDRDGLEIDRHLGSISGDDIQRRLGLLPRTSMEHR